MERVYLETDRLVLRRFTDDDAQNLFDLDSDPEVTRYTNGGQPPDMREIRERILPRFLWYYTAYDGFGFWAAIERVTGEFVGWFHFRPPADGNLDEIELGYRFKRSAWGKGYATEGSRALVEKGFRELGVRYVTAYALEANRASTRVMEKVGLRYEGEFVEESYPGEDKRGVRYGLRVEEYETPAS